MHIYTHISLYIQRHRRSPLRRLPFRDAGTHFYDPEKIPWGTQKFPILCCLCDFCLMFITVSARVYASVCTSPSGAPLALIQKYIYTYILYTYLYLYTYKYIYVFICIQIQCVHVTLRDAKGTNPEATLQWSTNSNLMWILNGPETR